MTDFFKNLLLNMVIPVLEAEGQKFLVDKLQELHDSNPKLYKGLVIGGHLLIDAVVEDLVAKTETKVDDRVVQDLKDVLATSAAKNGIVLPDLSEPTTTA